MNKKLSKNICLKFVFKLTFSDLYPSDIFLGVDQDHHVNLLSHITLVTSQSDQHRDRTDDWIRS